MTKGGRVFKPRSLSHTDYTLVYGQAPCTPKPPLTIWALAGTGLFTYQKLTCSSTLVPSKARLTLEHAMTDITLNTVGNRGRWSNRQTATHRSPLMPILSHGIPLRHTQTPEVCLNAILPAKPGP